MNNQRKSCPFLLILACILLPLSFSGCANDEKNPSSPAITGDLQPTGNARLSFNFTFPENWPKINGGVQADANTDPSVSIELILFDITSAKTHRLLKNSPVTGTDVSISFESLPAFPAVGKINFSAATYKSATSFTGSIDLVNGDNCMTMLPSAENGTTTVNAFVMEGVAKNPVKFRAAPEKLASEINKTVTSLSLDSPTIRSDSLATFLDTIEAGTDTGLNRGKLNCTIIVHGFDPGLSGEPQWMESMQDAIIAGSNGAGLKRKITISGSKGSLTATCNPWDSPADSATSGDLVMRIDWTAVANHLLSGVPAQDVAAAIAPVIYESRNGQKPVAELPLHLVGHSRGAGLVYELARLLGEKGIDVDHVTSLDAHPLTSADSQNPFLPVTDTTVKVYDNVMFTDSYWQGITYPKGEAVTGAYNRSWSSLTGGYHQAENSTLRGFADHLNIILMYHGTVALNSPVSNLEAELTAADRNSWFNETEGAGATTGFHFSRNKSHLNRSGSDAFKAGLHSALGGSGARQALTGSGRVWPNILSVEILRGGEPISSNGMKFTVGEKLTIRFLYRTFNNECTLKFFADTDQNPYNDTNVATICEKKVAGSSGAPVQATFEWNTADFPTVGSVYIHSEISDGSHTRYLYW